MIEATTIEIMPDSDRFVLHFETPKQSINAYALASTLVALADAVREANSIINPGYDVEVVVDTLEPGSFRAIVRTVLREAHNLFSAENARNIVLSILAAFLYDKLFVSTQPLQVSVTPDLVTVKNGSQTVVIPREIYDATKEVERSNKFRQSVSRLLQGATQDPSVEGLGFGPVKSSSRPDLYISREQFSLVQPDAEQQEGDTRQIVEEATLQISRAILERGTRKWEFYWRGIKVSAPILDERFYAEFFAHRVTIAPGDALDVKLRVTQQVDPHTGIYVNKDYEVVEVLRYIPRMTQVEGFRG
ncbi:hypothetical protein AB4Y36_08300 [Paraburkholderia sp. BR10936]|uniref:hypothetical protein n=1 Tax=Paraburkholderia sp. BR10936 TaxID=3236993 RepID=UPI0034D37906